MCYYKIKLERGMFMGSIEHFGYYENFSDFPEHRHDCCEILYLHQGEILLISNDKKYVLESGMLYVIPCGVNHKAELINKSVYNRTLVFINPWTYSGIHYSEHINDLLMGYTAEKPITAKDNFECDKLLQKIKRELEINDIASEDIITSAVTELLSNVFRQNVFLSDNYVRPNPVITEVKKYIREHCQEALRISDIADRFYINKFYLSHLFKEQTGMSPRQFLTFTRLSKAYCLVHETNIKISKISELCGFSSHSEMSKLFSEQYGVSPSEFRRKLSERYI